MGEEKQMSHTPGPWKLREIKDSSSLPRIFVIDNEDFADIAEIYTCIDKNFGPDDARLIAAAPELYEACKEILEAGFDATPEEASQDMVIYAEKRLRAAVAKAEGRQA